MTPKETAHKKISELVVRFEEQYASYKKAEYDLTPFDSISTTLNARLRASGPLQRRGSRVAGILAAC